MGAVLGHRLGRHAVLGPLVVAALIQSGAGGVPVLDTHWHLHLDSNLFIFYESVHNKTFWWGERVLHRSAAYFI